MKFRLIEWVADAGGTPFTVYGADNECAIKAWGSTGGYQTLRPFRKSDGSEYMSQPPIQYSGPKISPDVPWDVRQHLQLIYQRLGNHTQAFQLQSDQLNTLKKGVAASSGAVLAGGGSSSSSSSSSSTIASSLGATNNQTGAVTYGTMAGDNGSFVIVDSGSPVAVSLDTQTPPWFTYVINMGSGTATLTPATGTISYGTTSGASSMPVAAGDSAIAVFDGTNWEAIPVFGTAGAGGVSSLDGITGAVTLVAGAGISITDNTPSAGDITIANTASGGYLKGSASIVVGTSPDNQYFTATGITITGAVVGQAVGVYPGVPGFAANLPILSGVVTAANTVGVSAYYTQGIQAATGGFSVVNCNVLIVVFP